MDGLSSAVSAFPLAHTIRPSHYTWEKERESIRVCEKEKMTPLHSDLFLILEVNGQSSNENFILWCLAGAPLEVNLICSARPLCLSV